MNPRTSLLICLILAISCANSASSGPNPLTPNPPDPRIAANRYVWAWYWIDLDGAKAEATPLRQVADHWNVLKFLENGPCANCVKLLSFVPSGTGTVLVTVQVRHPFPSANLTGFDVRGIAMFSGTHAFPGAGVTVSDRKAGQGELVNADGFTTLYNIATAGSGPNGLQGYLKGKMATLIAPNVSLSGFKRYISTDPANTRNAFYSGATLTQTFEIDMPDTPLGFGYAVDASWVPPTTKPVTDPMTDFPPEANCPEPWRLDVTDQPVGTGLTDQGGSTVLTIDVYDRTGKDSHALPSIECPELFDGVLNAAWKEDQTGYSRYEITVENTKLAAAGEYKCLVSVEDNENASAPDWVQLISYQVKELTVAQGQPDHHQLWFYHGVNLLPDNNLTNAIQVVQQAAAAGYEKVVLADFKLGTIDIQSQTYWDHLQTYAQAVETAGLELIPSQVQIGYSDAVLCHDPNLIEGQPVRNAVFKVSGTTADIEQDPATTVLNGDFENHSDDTFPGWNQMDGAGLESFADKTVKHSGICSMRFDNFMEDGNGNDRIRQDIAVKPWQCYALSFWIKSENVQSAGDIRMQVFNNDISRTLEFLSLNVQTTQDWTHYYVIFNSQDLTSVALYFGIWGGESGRFWIDDLTIENAGLINLIRRDGCPFVVTSEDGSVTYQEGVDFEQVSDPLMGHAGSYTGTFDLYHDRPAITLTPGSKIQDGDRILVSYYHCVFVYDMQPSCCLTDDDVYDIWRSTMTKLNELIHPAKIFISVDEMRVANWCELCRSKGETPGQLLADATQRIDQIAHEVNPDWKLMTWSDMYDPNHNAHDDYYLVNGTLANSWDGLPVDWDIANWYNNQESTLAFFSDRGNRQILCGYYDETGPDFSIYQWLDTSKPYPGVYACMYTTWWKGYADLAAWAQVVKQWDQDNW